MASRALLLVSGGIDSPVAAHLLQEQGVEVEAIHFSIEPFTDNGPEEKSVAACARLGIPSLMVIPAGDPFGRLAKECAHRLYFVLSKRFMMRLASRVAKERGIPFIASGENLGQVSSQTLANLVAIDAASAVPTLRPLLGYDKVNIVDVAHAIDTFDVSVGPEVCDVLGPDHPSTQASLAEVLAEEEKVDIEAMIEKALGEARVVAIPMMA